MSTTVEQVLAHKGRECWSVGPETSVQDAVAVLSQHKIGAVLVCADDRLLGVFSERDCVRHVVSRKRSASETPVRDVMVTHVVCVKPSDSIQHCMSLMNDQRIRHLPVVVEERIVGVVSIGDAVNAVLRERECLIEQLEGYISGSPSVRPSH